MFSSDDPDRPHVPNIDQDFACTAPAPEAGLEQEDADRLLSVVLHGIANLEPRHRDVLDMMYLMRPKPLKSWDCAAILGISVEEVRKREQEAYALLRQAVQEARLPPRPTPGATRPYAPSNVRAEKLKFPDQP